MTSCLTSLNSSLSHRSSSSDSHKRKLDGVEDPLHKMKRREVSAESSNRSESTRLQIFVRMMSGGKTIVIQADKKDTVEHLHNRIELKTKIPANELRVIYQGKQLQLEHSLSDYYIEQDSSLHVLARMQSTKHLLAWQTVNDIMDAVSGILRGDSCNSVNRINDILVRFFDLMPKKDTGEYLEIFLNSSAPAALVTLYASPLKFNKSYAESSINLFFIKCIELPDDQRRCFLPIVLEFFRLLRRVCPRDKLYVSCRNTLGSVLDLVYNSSESRSSLLSIGDEIFPCLRDLVKLMVKQLVDDDDDDNSWPSSSSKVDPLHPYYFEFTGRVIALALMHKVQVGVLFDRVFFLQLTGNNIGLEDIKDTDQIMYNSCKQILEMDPKCFDSDAGLGLTFVSETEVLGKRETKELLKGGKSIAVNSKNREQYVNLLIKHRFATSVSEQVNQFSQGFSDILADTASFFKRLYVEDFDCMLGGGDNLISIDDWKAHTEYNGFKKADRQISWFWEILKKMTEEERRSVLFFWTSTRFLPVEGFRGLSSKLYIYRLHEGNDHLPTSHTCFYRLCLPKYPEIALMEQRLRLIAQDHVSSSFGQW